MQIIHNAKGMLNHRRSLRRSQTNEENILWQKLRNRQLNNLKFTRQHSIVGYVADFYCAEKRLVIEIDGGQHYSNEGLEYDNVRTKIFDAVNIKVLRFTNSQIRESLNFVLGEIVEASSLS